MVWLLVGVLKGVTLSNAHLSSYIKNCCVTCCSYFHSKAALLQHPTSKAEEVELPKYYLHFNSACDDDLKRKLTTDMMVIDDFVSEAEEKSMLDELEPYLKRLRYEFDHWDDAIHGYRETERLHWNPENTEVLNRVRKLAFPPKVGLLSLVHVLDLAENGYIKPHIDSVRFCGNTIAGISLLSPSVMRLVHDKEKEKSIDVLLKRRSLYVMKDFARYDFTHEILAKEKSIFKGENVPKSRRISVICRNEPKIVDQNIQSKH